VEVNVESPLTGEGGRPAGPQILTTPQTFLVTGGSRGIGAAVVERLAAAGRLVFLNYRNSQAEAMEVCERVRRAGGRVEPVQADVADRAAVVRMIGKVGEASGRLDGFIHNAAAPLVPKRLMKLDWDSDVAPQLSAAGCGFLNCIQAAGPLLQEGSRVVVVLTDALFHKPPVRMGAYLAAKGALWGLVRAAAKELQAQGVVVNTVSPGMTRTSLWRNYGDRALEILAGDHPLKRLARPEEVAAAIEWLATGAPGYVHGSNLMVNGGTEF